MKKILLFLLGCFLWVTGICSGEESIYRSDGSIDRDKFNQNWRKYSDIDDRIPLTSRSWEAQQHQAALDEIKEAEVEITRLSVQMELSRQLRLEMREYEQALRQGLKSNLMKAFIRLSWITYNTIGGPVGKSGAIGTGKTFSELLVKDSSQVAAIGKSVSVILKVIPKQYSKLPGNSGKVVNTGVDVIVEGMKTMDGSPAEKVGKITAKLFESLGNAPLPSADISEAEVDILRQQYSRQQYLKQAIAESYEADKGRQAQIEALKAQIVEARKKAELWEGREKARVYALIYMNSPRVGPLKVTLSGPKSLAVGGTAAITANVSGGSGNYLYFWVSTKPAAGGRPAVNATQRGESVVYYQAGAAGPHLIVLQVLDDLTHQDGQAGILIDVTDGSVPLPSASVPKFTPAPTQTRPTATPDRGGGKLLGTFEMKADQEIITPFITEVGKMYIIEASGVIVHSHYNEKTGKTNVVTADPVWYSYSLNGLRGVSSPFLLGNASEKRRVYFPDSTPYNPNHVYRLDYAGDGEAIQIYSLVRQRNYQSGSIIFKIYRK